MEDSPWDSSEIDEAIPYQPLSALTRAVHVTLIPASIGFALLSFADPAAHAESIGASVALLYLGVSPVWFAWHVRAARNAHALGRDTGISPWWHGLYWIVPVVLVWMPYVACKRLIEASHPSSEGYVHDPLLRDASEEGVRAPSWLGIWWACHLVGNVSLQIASDPERLEIMGSLAVAGALCRLVALGLYLRWISVVTERQQQIADAHGA